MIVARVEKSLLMPSVSSIGARLPLISQLFMHRLRLAEATSRDAYPTATGDLFSYSRARYLRLNRFNYTRFISPVITVPRDR